MDNGKISTIGISIVGAVLVYVITSPHVLEQLMGDHYLQYGAFVIVIMAIVYNALFPRNPQKPIKEASQGDEGGYTD